MPEHTHRKNRYSILCQEWNRGYKSLTEFLFLPWLFTYNLFLSWLQLWILIYWHKDLCKESLPFHWTLYLYCYIFVEFLNLLVTFLGSYSLINLFIHSYLEPALHYINHFYIFLLPNLLIYAFNFITLSTFILACLLILTFLI